MSDSCQVKLDDEVMSRLLSRQAGEIFTFRDKISEVWNVGYFGV